MNPNTTAAAERVRRLQHYVDAALREKLVAPLVLDLREVLKELTELRARTQAFDDASEITVEAVASLPGFEIDERSGDAVLENEHGDWLISVTPFGQVYILGHQVLEPHEPQTMGQFRHLLAALGGAK